jgi:hypothetical protein
VRPVAPSPLLSSRYLPPLQSCYTMIYCIHSEEESNLCLKRYGFMYLHLFPLSFPPPLSSPFLFPPLPLYLSFPLSVKHLAHLLYPSLSFSLTLSLYLPPFPRPLSPSLSGKRLSSCTRTSWRLSMWWLLRRRAVSTTTPNAIVKGTSLVTGREGGEERVI